jgi:hypothetical protein
LGRVFDVGALDALGVLPAGEVAGDELATVFGAQQLGLRRRWLKASARARCTPPEAIDRSTVQETSSRVYSIRPDVV